MTNLSFCLQQRQQEEQKSRKLLTIGLISSIVLHGAIGSATMLFKEEPKTSNKPIEMIIVDAPNPVTEVLKPKQEPPKPVQVTPPPPKPQPQKIEPVKTVQPQAAKPEPAKPTQPQAAKPEPAKPKIENRRASAKPGRPRAAGGASKPSRKLKPDVVASSQPQSRPSILTNPNPSASGTKVPEQPTVDNAPVVPSVPGTGNNTQGTGTGDSQGSGNGNGSGDSFGNGSGNGGNGSGNGGGGDGSGSSSPVAARPTPEPPKPTPKAKPKVGNCVRNCDVKYPSVLNGIEGRASVKVTVDRSGNVVNAEIARGHSNSQLNEQALQAARKMKFASRSDEGTASARVTINFTVAGSDFDRQARQKREQQERQARERREQQERQAREREQQRQAELERERRAQQQQQQQLEQPSTETPPSSDPIPPEIPETGQ